MRISRRHLFQGSLMGGAATLLGQTSSAQDTPSSPDGKRPRGVIFLVSDGMSHGVLSLTEAFSQQTRQRSTAWWDLLAHPRASHGLMDTASQSSLVTDSAAASSAWSSGKRVPNGQINVDENGKSLESIGETLVKKNVKLGLVSTATITHATPAGFAANTPRRGAEDVIAQQYLDRVDVILGGGSKFFDPRVRKDGKDLFSKYQKAKYDVCRTKEELLASKSSKLLGTFFRGHLPYSIDHSANAKLRKEVPTLAEMTEAALSRFLAGDEPFLLQVEGARIDHAAHKNDIGGLLHDQLAFDDALAKTLSLTEGREDILIILTSDHGNANPALNGTGARYAQTNEHFSRVAQLRGSFENLLATWKKKPGRSRKLMDLMEETFAFRPTKKEAEAVADTIAGKDVIEWSHQLSNPVGLLGQIVGNHTGTGWTGVSHTADPTQLTAFGPGAEQFAGLVRNDSVRERLLSVLLG